MNSPFEVLNKVDCSEHKEEKNGLSYLSWAWAWAELKKRYPASFYTIYENRDGLFYHTDGKTCWVKTGVTLVDGDASLEHIEYLPVMDNRNKSISKEAVTSFDVNKAIQRSLTKAVARHGLGLYIYAGEDLPEADTNELATQQKNTPVNAIATNVNVSQVNPPACSDCGCVIAGYGKHTAQDMAKTTKQRFGRVLCTACATEESARLKTQSA